MIRSIIAVVAGYIMMTVGVMALFAIWFQGDPNAKPSQSFMVFTLGYGLACAIVGGYATAVIARSSPMAHAWALAGLVAVMSIVSMVMFKGQEPLWFQISNTGMGVTGVCVGAFLRSRLVRVHPA